MSWLNRNDIRFLVSSLCADGQEFVVLSWDAVDRRSTLVLRVSPVISATCHYFAGADSIWYFREMVFDVAVLSPPSCVRLSELAHTALLKEGLVSYVHVGHIPQCHHCGASTK